MTDAEIRIQYLVDNGWDQDEAELFVREYPKPQSAGEAAAILNYHLKELGTAMERELTLTISKYLLIVSHPIWYFRNGRKAIKAVKDILKG